MDKEKDLSEVTKLELTEQQVQHLLHEQIVKAGLPPFAARQIAWQLQSKGLGPFPEVHTVPNTKTKIIISYQDVKFLAEAAGLDFLGAATLQIIEGKIPANNVGKRSRKRAKKTKKITR